MVLTDEMQPVIEGLEAYILEHGLQKRLDLNFSDFSKFNKYMALMVKKRDKLRGNMLPHIDLDSDEDSSDYDEPLPVIPATTIQDDGESYERGTLAGVIATPGMGTMHTATPQNATDAGGATDLHVTATILDSNASDAGPIYESGLPSPELRSEVKKGQQATSHVSMFDVKQMAVRKSGKLSVF